MSCHIVLRGKQMNRPLLSVIIPVYNAAHCLGRCIDSVNSQTYGNIEIVIVDDCSTDGIKDAIPEQDNIVYVSNEKNLGSYLSRIVGFEHSSGKYIAFLDGDDYVSPDFYRTMMSEAIAEDADIVAGDTVFEKNNGSGFRRNLHESNFGRGTIRGDDVKRAFFSHRTTCFVWHTVWNKIYRRELIERCLGDLKKVDRHLAMTDDILFSGVLFCNAGSFIHIANEGYRYCENEQSQTKTVLSDFEKYKSGISDVKYVFDFLEDYLKNRKTDMEYISDVEKSREFYSRIWRAYHLFRFAGTELERESAEVIDGLLPGYTETAGEHDHFFEMLETEYDSRTEELKKLISNNVCEAVCFDAFDTLLTVPFFEQSDVLLLLNGKYGKTADAWKRAEHCLRDAHPDRPYAFKALGILQSAKCRLSMTAAGKKGFRRASASCESKYCTERKFGKDLFELAKHLGKRIIVIAESYSDEESVRRLLEKNGYSGYEKMFFSGNSPKPKRSPYRKILKYTGLGPEHIVCVGRSYETDSDGTVRIAVPRCSSVMVGAGGTKTNSLGHLGNNYSESDLTGRSLAFRTMLSLASTKFFDDPFPAFNGESDFNGSPDIIGYYPVGMHLIGICKWIADTVSKSERKKVVFMSRFGFLPMKALEAYGSGAEISYAYSSHTVLSWLIDGKESLCNLPIDVEMHSPRSMCRLLDFCLDIAPDAVDSMPDGRFESKEDFHVKMKNTFGQYFSEDKLDRAKRTSRGYYRDAIPEGCFVFDAGHCGWAEKALSNALGYRVTFLNVYGENDMEKSGCDSIAMYDFIPEIPGLVREYILSENKAPCIGFADDGEPAFGEKDAGDRLRNYAIDAIQKSAVEFVKDYCKIHKGEKKLFDFEPEDVSSPFESMMQTIKDFDRYLFFNSYPEYVEYGCDGKTSVYEYWGRFLTEYYAEKDDAD